MRAAVKTKPAFGSMEVKSVPMPAVRDDEVLIEVDVASICGTDVQHIYNWDAWAQKRIKPPLIQGHEFCGHVARVGSACTWVKKGDYVSAEGHIACGHCVQCRTGNAHVCRTVSIIGIDRDGSFAQYLTVPERNVVKNDPALPPELATIQDPLGNSVYTVESADVPGKTVAVFGLGPTGLFAVALCKALGARRVYAIGHRNEYRISLAKKVGADVTIKSSEKDPVKAIEEDTGGEGVDEALEFSGDTEALKQAFDVVRPAGGVHILGIYDKPVELDVSHVIVGKGLRVFGIHGRKMFGTWTRMQGLLRAGTVNLKPLITHHFSLDDIVKGMELMRTGNCGKVVIDVAG